MSDDRLGVLLEDIQGKLQGLAEAFSVIQQDIAAMKPMVGLIPEMRDDIKTLKRVAKDQGDELSDHEDRIQMLEMPQRA